MTNIFNDFNPIKYDNFKTATTRIDELYSYISKYEYQGNPITFKKINYQGLYQRTEFFKKDIHMSATSILTLNTWDEFLASKKYGIISNQIYKSFYIGSNLLGWHEPYLNIKFDSIKTYNTDLIFYNLFKADNDEKSFKDLTTIFKSKLNYEYISYLFFLKNKDIYLPLVQLQWSRIFNFLGIKSNCFFKLNNTPLWENYKEFNDIMRYIHTELVYPKFLELSNESISLLDTHSFLWTMYKHPNFYKIH